MSIKLFKNMGRKLQQWSVETRYPGGTKTWAADWRPFAYYGQWNSRTETLMAFFFFNFYFMYWTCWSYGYGLTHKITRVTPAIFDGQLKFTVK